MGKECGSNVSSRLWGEALRDATNYIKRASTARETSLSGCLQKATGNMPQQTNDRQQHKKQFSSDCRHVSKKHWVLIKNNLAI